MIGALPPPEATAQEVYEECYESYKEQSRRARFNRATSDVLRGAKSFEVAVGKKTVAQLLPSDFESVHVTKDDMAQLYREKLQRKSGSARQRYDAIMSAVPYGRCPYCAQRRVSSLDHYLPKARFPTLAVAPLNLVPSCSDCNRSKGSYSPGPGSPPLLHPYSDDPHGFRWLYAIVTDDSGVRVEYQVRPPAPLSLAMQDSITAHASKLGLPEFYSAHAAQTVNELVPRLEQLYHAKGQQGVQGYLQEEATLKLSGAPNSWEGALFEALASEDWYTSGGFRRG